MAISDLRRAGLLAGLPAGWDMRWDMPPSAASAMAAIGVSARPSIAAPSADFCCARGVGCTGGSCCWVDARPLLRCEASPPSDVSLCAQG